MLSKRTVGSPLLHAGVHVHVPRLTSVETFRVSPPAGSLGGCCSGGLANIMMEQEKGGAVEAITPYHVSLCILLRAHLDPASSTEARE